MTLPTSQSLVLPARPRSNLGDTGRSNSCPDLSPRDLGSRIKQTSGGVFEISTALLASTMTCALGYGAFFCGRLSIAIILHGSFLGIIPGAISIALCLSATKCSFIAYREFNNGSKNFNNTLQLLIHRFA